MPAPVSVLIYCPEFPGDFSKCFSGNEMKSPFYFRIRSMRKTLEIDFLGQLERPISYCFGKAQTKTCDHQRFREGGAENTIPSRGGGHSRLLGGPTPVLFLAHSISPNKATRVCLRRPPQIAFSAPVCFADVFLILKHVHLRTLSLSLSSPPPPSVSLSLSLSLSQQRRRNADLN